MSTAKSGIRNGVIFQSITTITSAYTLSNIMTILADATSGNVNVTVPLASEKPNAVYVIKKVNSTNSVVLLRSGSDNIEGLANKSLYAENETITIMSDSVSSWKVLNTGSTIELQNEQTDDYTLQASDKDVRVNMNKGTAVNLTVPPYSSVQFPVGSKIYLTQIGDGQVTIVEGSGVVVNTPRSLKTRAKFSSATLTNIAQDEWILEGDIGNGLATDFYASSGGVITEAGGYRQHIFYSSDTLVVDSPGIVDQFLLIAGGGSGGCGNSSVQAGGGGAGEGRYFENYVFNTTGSLAVTIGNGGAAVNHGNGNNGQNSSIAGVLTVVGGGYGGEETSPGGNGACGGGGGTAGGETHPGGIGSVGYNGGASGTETGVGQPAGGGGGGMGGPGGNSGGGTQGVGGQGIVNSFHPYGSYCGGGGGTRNWYETNAGANGGGYGGGWSTGGVGSSAVANTGSGGGASTADTISGAGGSGICILKYKIAN